MEEVTGTDTCSKPSLGSTPLRRLTRRQYERTIRDLLGVVADPEGVLPSDEKVGLFDANIAAPPDQYAVDTYRALAEEVAVRAQEDLATILPCDAITDFHGQWLATEALIGKVKDTTEFPFYDDARRSGARKSLWSAVRHQLSRSDAKGGARSDDASRRADASRGARRSRTPRQERAGAPWAADSQGPDVYRSTATASQRQRDAA